MVWQAITNTVLGIFKPGELIKTALEGKQRKRELENVIHQKQLERAAAGQIAEVEWNSRAQQNSGWKDEWLTLLFSIPLIGAFIPTVVPYISKGFLALEATPLWYRSAIGVMVASAFGYQKFAKNKMMKAYTLPKKISKIETETKKDRMGYVTEHKVIENEH